MSAPRLSCVAVLLSMCITSAAFAQATTAKPPVTPAKKTSKPSTTTGDNKSVKQDGGYPDIVTKELYADVDLRGKAAPTFKVEKWLTSEPDRKGKTVIIDFWATWCGPCKKLMPELSQWQKTFKDDLIVIGVSDEKPETVGEFLKKTKVDYSIATDTAAVMYKSLKIRGIPHVLVISSDGIVRWQGLTSLAPDTLTTEKLKQIIDADKAARAKNDTSKDAKPAKTTDKPATTDKPTTTDTSTGKK